MKHMKKQGKRILAAALCAGVFAGAMPVSVLADAVAGTTAAGWLAASPQAVQPLAAQADALEETGGLTYAANAVVSTIDPFGTVYEMRQGWNNTGSYHASINSAQQLFGKTAFTILLDVKTEDTSSGDALTRSAALSIGNSSNALRISTYAGDLRWGAYPSGVSATSISSSRLKA